MADVDTRFCAGVFCEYLVGVVLTPPPHCPMRSTAATASQDPIVARLLTQMLRDVRLRSSINTRVASAHDPERHLGLRSEPVQDRQSMGAGDRLVAITPEDAFSGDRCRQTAHISAMTSSVPATSPARWRA